VYGFAVSSDARTKRSLAFTGLQIFAFINRHDDQEDLVGAPLAGARIPGTRKGCPYGPTFCGNMYRAYKRMQKLVI
ncbi:MAG: hypothetical protein ACQEQN_00440, partial [Thermodesulfobacteriota bacterium]